MLYRRFGNTGIDISALGFGAMRLPMNGKEVNDELAVPLIQRGFDLGINYIDTAWFYCDNKSEYTVGKALKGYRDRVYLSTKFPIGDDSTADDYRSKLEEQLRKLDQDYIDFYHFHGIGKGRYENVIVKNKLIEAANKAKDEGLIRHISFSFHDKSEAMIDLIDTGHFESVLCQYNMLDRSNEHAIAHAHAKGLGVVVMGPVGGGNLSYPIDALEKAIGNKCGTPELAMRFVLSNNHVSCALSGMGDLKMLEENASVASDPTDLTAVERESVLETCEQLKALSDLYCTGCNYCMPCPSKINIPQVFKNMNMHKVYGATELAKKRFSEYGTHQWTSARLEDCIDCGACEKKCPQNIEIRKQLKEVISELK